MNVNLVNIKFLASDAKNDAQIYKTHLLVENPET